jgi:MIP family channel proteins
MHEHRDASHHPAHPEETAIAPAAASELIGSFAVVLVGAGSVVVAGSVGGGLVGVALATGFAFGASLAATLPSSGGGVNPVLTIGFWIVGHVSTERAIVFVAAQALGAVLAGLLLRTAVPDATWRLSRLGAPLLAEGVGAGRAVLVEAVFSFLLTLFAFASIVDERTASSGRAAAMLGAMVAAATLVAWPLTGASLNPVRALGPELAGGEWSGWWIYWIGPIAGGVVGAVTYWWAFLRGTAADAG